MARGNEQTPSNPSALSIAYEKAHWQIIEEEKGKFKGSSVKFGMYTTVSSQTRGAKMTFFRWFSLYSSGWLVTHSVPQVSLELTETPLAAS